MLILPLVLENMKLAHKITMCIIFYCRKNFEQVKGMAALSTEQQRTTRHISQLYSLFFLTFHNISALHIIFFSFKLHIVY